jgi:lipopolysaccharide transport system ATP-binding protein
MGDVAKEGRTVLFVSHNMGAVKNLCNQGILLMNGNIISNMGIDSVIEEYFRVIGTLSNNLNDRPAHQQVIDNFIVNSGNGVVLQNEELELSVEFHIENKGFSGFSLYCIIEDMSGKQIIHDRKESTDLNMENLQNHYKVNMKLPALWLNPGLYSVYFKVLYWGLKGQERYVSDKYPLHISGESNRVDSLLNPKIDWKLTICGDY